MNAWCRRRESNPHFPCLRRLPLPVGLRRRIENWSEQKDSNLHLSLPRGVILPLNYAQERRSRAARRDRTCLVLLVEQVLSLDGQRRVSFVCVGDARTHVARRPWITRESNTVRAPYQRAQGDQPVVIRRGDESCEKISCEGRGGPEVP